MSGCKCSIEGNCGDDCSFAFGDNALRRARKKHRCCECGRVIEKGKTYDYFSGLYEGTFYAYKTCIDCVSARVLFCSHDFEEMWSDFREYMQETSILPCSCLAKLTPRAREMACEIIEEIWEADE